MERQVLHGVIGSIAEHREVFGVTDHLADPVGRPMVLTPSVVSREIVLPTIAGFARYRIPIGAWFVEGDATSLEIDSGSGWVEQAYGPDYSHLRRYTPPLTVSDLCVGWELAGAPPAGWMMRFRWVERYFSFCPDFVAPVFLDAGGSPDYSVGWNQAIDGRAPNGVQLPELAGCGVEFWRMTGRTGGVRGTHEGTTLGRSGKRWVPYYRHPVGRFIIGRGDFSSAGMGKMRQFRVRYYDPVSGARGPLSPDIIAVGSGRENRVRTVGTIHAANAVWLKR